MEHITHDELMAHLPDMLDAPKDNVKIDTLCLRPDYGARDFVDEITLTVDRGIPGERWENAPWMKLDDGSPDPRIQVSILGKRVMDAVWRDRENTPHPGDTIIADLDCSHENLPVGQRLKIGGAIVEVSDVFNDACVKWKVRYGKDAKNFITIPEHVPYRLRGVLCRVVQNGVIRKTDTIIKV
ncbi:hypothetical protein GCM10008927_01330 [Amylibacter ulvae]|uniref:MOSC domain-containing protein n=1 Tax=Paramylibacter ulvae TaxID=1651968 RepID=A0ABQ3CXG0_9RHOB|nr:hypothetical protein [Amylibacter ulvae]GHA40836.1 hypothetical protein GCM10008927_01330 [Amylibacter ulvae]